MTFTNQVRKLLGLSVRRGMRGPKRYMPVPEAPKAVLNGASGLTYDTVGKLEVGQGVLLPTSQWRRRFVNFDSAEATIRARHPQCRFSIRRVLQRGRGQDMLVLRLK